MLSAASGYAVVEPAVARVAEGEALVEEHTRSHCEPCALWTVSAVAIVEFVGPPPPVEEIASGPSRTSPSARESGGAAMRPLVSARPAHIDRDPGARTDRVHRK